MTLGKSKKRSVKSQPENCESDVESCHEDMQDVRYSQIAVNAYYRAEARGFEPGYELDDWLAAENEIGWN